MGIPDRDVLRPSSAAIGSVVAVVYAWWATGLDPFTTLAYTAVALPSLALVTAYGVAGGWGGRGVDAAAYYRQQSRTASLSDAYPWLAIVIAATTLEVIGLVLGGRSSTFPTLSTTVDAVLGTHAGRFVLFGAWLWVGFTPVRRLAAHRQTGGG